MIRKDFFFEILMLLDGFIAYRWGNGRPALIVGGDPLYPARLPLYVACYPPILYREALFSTIYPLNEDVQPLYQPCYEPQSITNDPQKTLTSIKKG